MIEKGELVRSTKDLVMLVELVTEIHKEEGVVTPFPFIELINILSKFKWDYKKEFSSFTDKIISEAEFYNGGKFSRETPFESAIETCPVLLSILDFIEGYGDKSKLLKKVEYSLENYLLKLWKEKGWILDPREGERNPIATYLGNLTLYYWKDYFKDSNLYSKITETLEEEREEIRGILSDRSKLQKDFPLSASCYLLTLNVIGGKDEVDVKSLLNQIKNKIENELSSIHSKKLTDRVYEFITFEHEFEHRFFGRKKIKFPRIQYIANALIKLGGEDYLPVIDKIISVLINFINESRNFVKEKGKYPFEDTYFSAKLYITYNTFDNYSRAFFGKPVKDLIERVLLGPDELYQMFCEVVRGSGSVVVLGEITMEFKGALPENAVIRPYPYLNAVLALDKKEGLISTMPFGRYVGVGYVRKVEGEEFEAILSEIKDVFGPEFIPKPVQKYDLKQILEAKGFRMHAKEIEKVEELRKLLSREDALKAIHDYYELVPEYNEERVAKALGFQPRSRVDAELKLAECRLFSRMYANGELKELVDREIKSLERDEIRGDEIRGDEIRGVYVVLDEASAALLLGKYIELKKQEAERFIDTIPRFYLPERIKRNFKERIKDLESKPTRKGRFREINKAEIPNEIMDEVERVAKELGVVIGEEDKLSIVFALFKGYILITNSFEVARVANRVGCKFRTLLRVAREIGGGEEIVYLRIPIDLWKGGE